MDSLINHKSQEAGYESKIGVIVTVTPAAAAAYSMAVLKGGWQWQMLSMPKKTSFSFILSFTGGGSRLEGYIFNKVLNFTWGKQNIFGFNSLPYPENTNHRGECYDWSPIQLDLIIQ